MDAKQIPLLYFLPTVIMVDDHQSFIENFGMELGYTGLLETYTNPRKAIENLISRDNMFSRWDEFLSETEYDDIDSESEIRSINYNAIIQTVFSKKRFYEPAIVIVDYSMPEMNGIEFCRSIQKHPCLKIMLTGDADHLIAVEAFNEGLIDKFILKDINASKKDVIDSIKNLVMRYFINLSGYLWRNEKSISACEGYIKVFNNWVKEKNIVEYYSVSDNGSKLGISSNGQIRWFVSNLDAALKNYVNVAIDYGVSEDIIKLLKSGKNQLALLTEKQKKETPTNWEKYIVNIDKSFQYNRSVVYCSFVDHMDIDGINNNDIISVQDAKNKEAY